MQLDQVLTEEGVRALREALAAGAFPGLSLEHALLFLRSGGIMPASGLPLESFFLLEAWAEEQIARNDA
jgi:hypothetical protein